jgi:Na+/H+ antiporter NhaD/arsenite permease-like protein
MRRNRKRREKLGDLCFELAKYILTAVVVGWFIEPNIPVRTFVVALISSAVLLGVGYFLFPLDEKEA